MTHVGDAFPDHVGPARLDSTFLRDYSTNLFNRPSRRGCNYENLRCIPAGFIHRFLHLPSRQVDHLAFATLRGIDAPLFIPFQLGEDGSSFALGLHLLLERMHDLVGRGDVTDFSP